MGSHLLGQLLLGGLLLLLHDLGDGGRGLLSLALLELADLVPVVGMVRVIGVQEVELGVVDLVLSYPRFKFRSISRKREKREGESDRCYRKEERGGKREEEKENLLNGVT